MSDHRDAINYVSKSVIKLIDESITEAELAKLEDILIHDEIARKHYYELIYVSIAMKNSEGILGLEGALDFDMDLWKDMAEFEETAPMIEIPKEKMHIETVLRTVEPPRKATKTQNIVFLMSLAAMFFFALLLQLNPENSYRIEVATISDSINAKWENSNVSNLDGTRLAADRKLLVLQEGLIELKFDTNVRVVIEAPSEFQIVDKDKIALTYGRLYSTVSHEASGFTIYTQNSTIIDLGTEFGVLADSSGETELHVFKGEVLLSSQVSEQTNKAITVSVGQARHVDNKGHVSVISEKLEKFVRTIEERYSVIADFQERTDDILPSGWDLVDNNGAAPGPYYINLANSGPLGLGDTCASIGPADDSLEGGPNYTPGGWIQCLKSYDNKTGFYGSFDFCIEDISGGPDAQFLLGDLSESNKNYFLISVHASMRSLHEVFTVVGEQRQLFDKPTVFSDLKPKSWYSFCFRYVPNKDSTGDFSYKVTNPEGSQTYLTMDSKRVTFPDTVTFGFGTRNDKVRFDNIKIIPLSE